MRRTRPDEAATLADGVVVDLFLAARLLGRRILTLDGRVVLSPTRARALDPTTPATVRRRSVPDAVGAGSGSSDEAADDETPGEVAPTRRPGLEALRRRVDDNSRRLDGLRAAVDTTTE